MTRAEQAGEEQKTFVMLSLRSGRSQDFSNVVRGVRLCQSEGTYQIVMSVSPPAVGCSPKKGLQKGGHGSQHTPPPPGKPQMSPLAGYLWVCAYYYDYVCE